MNKVYYDWLDKLYEYMDWQPDGKSYTWLCGKEGDKFGLAKLAAADMAADFDALMAESAHVSRAHCDCELIFNCDDR